MVLARGRRAADLVALHEMFTGLVEECGEVSALSLTANGARLSVHAPLVGCDAKIGDSIAVNGCCLTVTACEGETLSFDLLSETLERTSLRGSRAGMLVNLERALAAHARLGGHFVQGHIDGASEVVSFERVGADHRLEISLPPEFAKYVAYKGSIAIDGISLTVAELKPTSFIVWIIPHTLEVTNLRVRKVGDRVNLEFDLLAKYVERMLSSMLAGAGSAR